VTSLSTLLSDFAYGTARAAQQLLEVFPTPEKPALNVLQFWLRLHGRNCGFSRIPFCLMVNDSLRRFGQAMEVA